jgi:hypothetical protein
VVRGAILMSRFLQGGHSDSFAWLDPSSTHAAPRGSTGSSKQDTRRRRRRSGDGGAHGGGQECDQQHGSELDDCDDDAADDDSGTFGSAITTNPKGRCTPKGSNWKSVFLSAFVVGSMAAVSMRSAPATAT